MCTVSWIQQEDGYELLSNRDEMLARGPARPPEIHEQHGVRFIAPIDSDFGGTWIGTNEFGVSICLLNGEVWRGVAENRASRGALMLDLMDSSCVGEVGQRLLRRNLAPFADFKLIALGLNGSACLLEWDGSEIGQTFRTEALMPLTSSSFDPAGVQVSRREELVRIVRASGGLHSETLLRFHRSHSGGPSAYSPCMHRPDAETVSLSQVRVGEDEASLSYRAGAPCKPALVQVVKLGLRRQEGRWYNSS